MRRLAFTRYEPHSIQFNSLHRWVERQFGEFNIGTKIRSSALYDRLFPGTAPEIWPQRVEYHIRLREIEAAEGAPITQEQINYHTRELTEKGYLNPGGLRRGQRPGVKGQVYPGWFVTKKAIDWYYHYRGPRPGWPVEPGVPPVPVPEPELAPPSFLRIICRLATVGERQEFTVTISREIGTMAQ